MFLREKICQYLNFGKIFYLGTFCAHTCLQEAFKKGIRVGLEIRTKSWPKSQKIQIFTVLTPPTLAKSATKLDSIKKLTKGLFLISPIPGRMQKFREIVCADREKGIRIFSGFIYVTTTRTGQGPYPALNDNECTNSDHLGGRRGHCQVFASGQVFRFYRRVLTVNLCEVWFVCYIAIGSTKINLFEHCCSSHNRGLAFVISRRRLEGAGPGEHGVAHFKTTKNIPVKICNLKN